MLANPKPNVQPETTLASRFAPRRPCMCSCGWPHQTMHSMNGAPLRRPRIFRQKRYPGPSGPRSLPVPSEINAHSRFPCGPTGAPAHPAPMQCCLVPLYVVKTESVRLFRSQKVSTREQLRDQHCTPGERGAYGTCKVEVAFISLGTDPMSGVLR